MDPPYSEHSGRSEFEPVPAPSASAILNFWAQRSTVRQAAVKTLAGSEHVWYVFAYE
jgi:hypothetical protein